MQWLPKKIVDSHHDSHVWIICEFTFLNLTRSLQWKKRFNGACRVPNHSERRPVLNSGMHIDRDEFYSNIYKLYVCLSALGMRVSSVEIQIDYFIIILSRVSKRWSRNLQTSLLLSRYMLFNYLRSVNLFNTQSVYLKNRCVLPTNKDVMLCRRSIIYS